MGFEWGWADLNWIAVIVAFAANMALGFVSYSPKGLLPMWKEDMGMTDETIKSANMVKTFGGMVVLLIIATISLALIIGNIGGGLEEGLVVGAVIGFGIAAGNAVPHYLFGQQPIRLAVINELNTAIGITLSGLIIGAFNA
ncbi:MAG: DUF1761 domain-containing protein [Chloroflexi bacterium]|nr:DUF1761 domain-containing protein [Chloroflexota bacterium]